jgi:hypothetical protein
VTHDGIQAEARDLVDAMSQRLSLVQPNFHIKERADGPYLVIEVAKPNERLFRILRESQRSLPEDHPFCTRATILTRSAAPTNRLLLPETQLLRATLSESLTVDQHTFSEDFFARYTRSVFGYEDQIVSDGNHIVYGRRGSGKSSLLAYAMHVRAKQRRPYAWIGMQAYAERDDIQVSVDVIRSVLEQLSPFAAEGSLLPDICRALTSLEALPDSEVQRALPKMLPKVGRELTKIGNERGDTTIFIDDLHVVAGAMQPKLLGHLYACSRGNRCHLKISGIEQFSHPWDATVNVGLQPPHDAQVLKLDYNLTMPDKSKVHITSILDAHAAFCGLPDVGYVTGNGVLSRLVWVAAAVPRDALNLFAQAIAKGGSQGQKLVSITSVNAAASEMAEQKLRDMHQDYRGTRTATQAVLERIKIFCVQKKRKNAFLVEISNDNAVFRCIQDLIALRLIHVIHEGITPHRAGRRYQALLLDYGFYVGVRAAKSVDLFHKEPKTPTVQELRKLPIFSADSEVDEQVDSEHA